MDAWMHGYVQYNDSMKQMRATRCWWELKHAKASQTTVAVAIQFSCAWMRTSATTAAETRATTAASAIFSAATAANESINQIDDHEDVPATRDPSTTARPPFELLMHIYICMNKTNVSK